MIGMLLTALAAGPSYLLWGLGATLFLDLVRVATAFIVGAVPRQFIAAGAFTTVLWQDVSTVQSAVVLFSGPLLLALLSRKRKRLRRLAVLSLAICGWQFLGGIVA
jgi:hypothetical protein